MNRKNLGLVKSIFRQSTAPVRTDVLWYDIINYQLKYFDLALLSWVSLRRAQLSGVMTINTPTKSEITSVLGVSPSGLPVGFSTTIRNTNDNDLYKIVSDGFDWYYKKLTKVDIVEDYDGNLYHIITIGSQQWLLENFRCTHYRDGSSIPNITSGASWIGDTTGAYCWHNNDISRKTLHGALYNWYAVNNAHELAPTGWHISTRADWLALISFLDSNYNEIGGKLKEVGITHWVTPNLGAIDEVLFTALPSSGRSGSSGVFWTLGTSCFFWTGTQYDSNNAYYYQMSYLNAYLTQDRFESKNYGFSVRCVKDI